MIISSFINDKTYEDIIPVEVKYREDSWKIRGLVEFMEKFNIKRGIVVTKDPLKEEEINGRKVLFIPLWIFLLLF